MYSTKILKPEKKERPCTAFTCTREEEIQEKHSMRTLNQQHERSLVWILDGYGWLFFIIFIKISIKIPHITKHKLISFLLLLYYNCISYDNVITYQVHTVLSQPNNQSNNCRDLNVYKQLGKNRAEVMFQCVEGPQKLLQVPKFSEITVPTV